MATAEDLWAERFARVLWVRGGDVPRPWPALRAQCVRTRARAAAPPAGPLLLGYDVAHEAELQRQRQAKQRALAKANAPPPPRRDVYVKGAMEWEKNAWRVWDKKKAQEEVRRDKYSTALTSYLAGNKIVVRDEAFALSQCAHCDQGGGIHPLRRCMGCLAVSYCCRAHQAVHWQWHKHICFAIRAANSLEARKGEGAGWVKLRPRRWKRPPIEKGAVVETNTRLRFASWKQFFTNGAPGTHARRTLDTHARRMHGTRTARYGARRTCTGTEHRSHSVHRSRTRRAVDAQRDGGRRAVREPRVGRGGGVDGHLRGGDHRLLGRRVGAHADALHRRAQGAAPHG